MSEPVPPSRGPLVLYVDDDRGNRIVFEQSLSSEFNLLTAPNAAEALELLEVHDVAVIVSDMRMPAMTGDELLRIVKERYPQVIRMVVTAYADVDPILRAINEGLVARYIIKPWIRTELIQVLRWAIEAWTFSRDSAALHRRLLETERLATLGSIAGMLVHDLKQPDGASFKARQWGDEWQSGWETQDGYTIVHEKSTGHWSYPDLDATGNLVPSQRHVGKHIPGAVEISLALQKELYVDLFGG